MKSLETHRYLRGEKINGNVTGRTGHVPRETFHVDFWAIQVSWETLHEVHQKGDGKSGCMFPGNFSCGLLGSSSFPGNLSQGLMCLKRN